MVQDARQALQRGAESVVEELLDIAAQNYRKAVGTPMPAAVTKRLNISPHSEINGGLQVPTKGDAVPSPRSSKFQSVMPTDEEPLASKKSIRSFKLSLDAIPDEKAGDAEAEEAEVEYDDAMERAAIKIQKVARGYRARKKHGRRGRRRAQKEHSKEELEKAAVTIQRYAKGYIVRKSMKRERGAPEAAAGAAGAAEEAPPPTADELEAAALMIQKHARGYIVRKKTSRQGSVSSQGQPAGGSGAAEPSPASREVTQEELDRAAVTIQRYAKGHVVRKRMSRQGSMDSGSGGGGGGGGGSGGGQRKEEGEEQGPRPTKEEVRGAMAVLERHAAAQRGPGLDPAASAGAQTAEELERAATTIQRYAKGYMVRKKQGRGRRRQQRAADEVEAAAVTIQRYARGYMTRKRAASIRASSSAAGGEGEGEGGGGAPRGRDEVERAALTIQRHLRGYQARKKHGRRRRRRASTREEEEAAAIKIQKVARGHRVRRSLSQQHQKDAGAGGGGGGAGGGYGSSASVATRVVAKEDAGVQTDEPLLPPPPAFGDSGKTPLPWARQPPLHHTAGAHSPEPGGSPSRPRSPQRSARSVASRRSLRATDDDNDVEYDAGGGASHPPPGAGASARGESLRASAESRSSRAPAGPAPPAPRPSRPRRSPPRCAVPPPASSPLFPPHPPSGRGMQVAALKRRVDALFPEDGAGAGPVPTAAEAAAAGVPPRRSPPAPAAGRLGRLLPRALAGRSPGDKQDTARSGLGRSANRRLREALRTAERERGFHGGTTPVWERRIPAYDAVLDPHCTWVERPAFWSAVRGAQVLSPEQQRALLRRVARGAGSPIAAARQLEQMAAALRAAVDDGTPAPTRTPARAPPRGPAPARPRLPPLPLRLGGPAGPGPLPPFRDPSPPSRLRGARPASASALAAGPARAAVDELGPIDPATAAGGPACEAACEAAKARLEQLWAELYYPMGERARVRGALFGASNPSVLAALRSQLDDALAYRSLVVEVLRQIRAREALLEEIEDEGAGLDEARIGQLLRLSRAALAAIAAWRDAFWWNKVFMFRGVDYAAKVEGDLQFLRDQGVDVAGAGAGGAPP
eukprot:tig00000600_g2268.t1